MGARAKARQATQAKLEALACVAAKQQRCLGGWLPSLCDCLRPACAPVPRTRFATNTFGRAQISCRAGLRAVANRRLARPRDGSGGPAGHLPPLQGAAGPMASTKPSGGGTRRKTRARRAVDEVLDVPVSPLEPSAAGRWPWLGSFPALAAGSRACIILRGRVTAPLPQALACVWCGSSLGCPAKAWPTALQQSASGFAFRFKPP